MMSSGIDIKLDLHVSVRWSRQSIRLLRSEPLADFPVFVACYWSLLHVVSDPKPSKRVHVCVLPLPACFCHVLCFPGRVGEADHLLLLPLLVHCPPAHPRWRRVCKHAKPQEHCKRHLRWLPPEAEQRQARSRQKQKSRMRHPEADCSLC